MTSYDWEVLAVAVCISVVAGVILGIFVHHRIKLTISLIAVVALASFCTLQWRFGGPQTWPWQDTATQNIWMFSELFLVIAVPMTVAASLSRSWTKQRKSSNQSLEPTAGRRDARI
jgi:hypothetical protein